jgi:putative methionine-R-sulfoxide reductase with GAF domain
MYVCMYAKLTSSIRLPARQDRELIIRPRDGEIKALVVVIDVGVCGTSCGAALVHVVEARVARCGDFGAGVACGAAGCEALSCFEL